MFNIGRKISLALTLAAMVAVAAPAANAIGLTGTVADYGSVAPENTAGRKIVLTADTKYVNVENGETVTFIANGQSFTWHFNTFPTLNNFKMTVLAPSGINVDGIQVYVADNPLYRS